MDGGVQRIERGYPGIGNLVTDDDQEIDVAVLVEIAERE